MSQNVESILSDLVEIPSVTADREANDRILDYTQAFLAERGMHVERRDHDGFGALVATTQNTMTPDVMLVAHADVVPGKPEQFRLSEEDGKLLGRGVFDMKGGLAAHLAVVDEIGAVALKNYNFGIQVVTGEEIAGPSVKLLLEEGFVPKAAVLPDGARDWQLERAAKGAWTVRVDAAGRPVHGSRPWEGESASMKLLDFLADVRALFSEQSAETNTLNISKLSAGEAQNQLPAAAQAILDIRVVGQAEYLAVRQQVIDLCAAHGVDPEVIAFFPPNEHDFTNPYIAQFIDSVHTVTGVEAGSGIVSLGSSDAVHYAAHDIPCVVTRPPGGDQHGDGEWIERKGLQQLVSVLHHYLDRVAKVADEPAATS